MADSPDPKPHSEGYDSIWRLECDAKKRVYTLTIELDTENRLGPMEHERLHDQVYKKACQFLEVRGIDPAQIRINISCQRVPPEVSGIEDNETEPLPDLPVEIDREEEA